MADKGESTMEQAQASTTDDFKYPAATAQFETAGRFRAWVAGSGQSTRGFSAVAWRVEQCEGGSAAIEDRKRSVQPDSTAPRAFLSDVVGILEMLPPTASVEIISGDQVTVDTINQYLGTWSEQDWTKADGNPAANLDILKRILKVLRERELEVTARRCVDQDPRSPDRQTLARLGKLAGALRKSGGG